MNLANGNEKGEQKVPADALIPSRPKDPDWDDYWAHRVAEKAKRKVLSYFAIATVLVSALLAFYGIDGIKKLLEDKFTKLIEQKEQEASARIEKRLNEFEEELDKRRFLVRTKTEEYLNHLVVAPRYRPPTTEVAFERIDLSAEIGEIRDTGPESTTVAFAVAYALQAAIKTKTGNEVVLSPRGIYETAKRFDEWPGEDYMGTSISGALKAVKEVGAYTEADWPYSSKTIPADIKKPSYRISSYKQINGIEQILNEMRQGRVVIAGIMVTKDFDKPDKDGRVVIKSPLKPFGGKAICLVGYYEERVEFRFANDWGANWGQKGFGLIRDTDLERVLQKAYTLEL